MFRVIVTILLSIVVMGLLALAWTGVSTTSAPAASSRTSPPDINRAIQDCGIILGFREDTVMTKERIALMSLCMSPELKHVALPK